MLEQAAGLSSRALEAIAELERRVLENDGGRLKLEWGRLRRRAGDRVEDLLWWEEGRLLGFLGLYSYGSSRELAGMVTPDARRRGIGSALLDAATPLYRGRDIRKALLIVPRPSLPGRRLALSRGAVLDHSEHALVLSGPPPSAPPEPGLIVRAATAADLPDISQVLAMAFGEPLPTDLHRSLERPDQKLMALETEGSVIGTLNVTRDGDEARIHGFAVDPNWQGRGIGREALRRVCEQQHATGAERIGLEVAVDNDRALGLYTSVGFEPIITEDYFALPLS